MNAAKPIPVPEKWQRNFWKRVGQQPREACWEWRGAIAYTPKRPYGLLYVSDQAYKAHRMSWTLHFGEPPPGMLVCHKCDNHKCVNPAHLFLGTTADNTYDMIRKGRAILDQGPKGQYAGGAKLTDGDFDEIRERYKAGETARALAAEYGVTSNYVSSIGNGRFQRRREYGKRS